MRINNKKAYFKYNILDKFEAGIVLSGTEVKAFRSGAVSINEAFVRVMNGQMYLINAHFKQIPGTLSSTRTRKLLLHKREIEKLENAVKAKKLTLIPLFMYTKGRLIKVEVALVKAKKNFQKREKIKKRDLDRQMERESLEKY